jgi:cobalt-zinc-cadmium efflux system membrane fusion protein
MNDATIRTAALSPPRRLLQALPSLAAGTVLLAVGWWGHHTGWAAPSFSSLFGGAVPPAEDWCNEHGVPDSQCIACHPELAGENAADWCKEHGVAESKCTVCHPEILLTGVANDWCKEHGVPESCCTICHPELARKGELPADADEPQVLAVGPEADVAVPGKDPKTCQKHALKVQFASAASIARAGVRLGTVIERPMAESLAAPAEVGYDRTRCAKVLARAAGIARFAGRDLGDAVAAGEVLAIVDTGEVGREKAELLAASAAARAADAAQQRLARGVAGGFRSETEKVEAAAAAQQQRIRLYNSQQALAALGLPLPDGEPTPANVARLGIPDAQWGALPEPVRSANLLPLPAPLPGVVVARNFVVGEAVAADRVLYELADPTRMWVTIDAPQALAPRLSVGQRVVFRPDRAPDRMVSGAIDWISPAFDEVTRTLQARATVANTDGALRANTFGTAQIVVRPTAKAVAVPNEAVQWEGCCHVVFVRLADTVFQPRKVRIGARDSTYTEILVGVLPGEVIATTASHVLTAAILKSNLGAGCCDNR